MPRQAAGEYLLVEMKKKSLLKQSRVRGGYVTVVYPRTADIVPKYHMPPPPEMPLIRINRMY